jgi:hypothetical protein
MQQDDYEAYRPYLQPDMRLEMGIPLTGGGVFRDWAIVSEFTDDKLLVQISRDVLPANVRIDVGFVMDVSVVIKQNTYTCGGIVTAKDGARVMWVQLFGQFKLREKRQFFRLDINLKIEYALVTDEDRSEVEADWHRRKDLEYLNYQGFDDAALAAERALIGPVKERNWRKLIRTEVNLGGGGIGIRLPEPVAREQLICLVVHLPLNPPRQVQAVAQVMMVKPGESRGRRTFYEAGMQFAFLDDKDRELIFQHVSQAQIENLRETASRRDLPVLERRERTPAEKRRLALMQGLWLVLFLILTFYLVNYLITYQETHPPNEIHRTYEKAIKEYRHEN